MNATFLKALLIGTAVLSGGSTWGTQESNTPPNQSDRAQQSRSLKQMGEQDQNIGHGKSDNGQKDETEDNPRGKDGQGNADSQIVTFIDNLPNNQDFVQFLKTGEDAKIGGLLKIIAGYKQETECKKISESLDKICAINGGKLNQDALFKIFEVAIQNTNIELIELLSHRLGNKIIENKSYSGIFCLLPTPDVNNHKEVKGVILVISSILDKYYKIKHRGLGTYSGEENTKKILKTGLNAILCTAIEKKDFQRYKSFIRYFDIDLYSDDFKTTKDFIKTIISNLEDGIKKFLTQDFIKDISDSAFFKDSVRDLSTSINALARNHSTAYQSLSEASDIMSKAITDAIKDLKEINAILGKMLGKDSSENQQQQTPANQNNQTPAQPQQQQTQNIQTNQIQAQPQPKSDQLNQNDSTSTQLQQTPANPSEQSSAQQQQEQKIDFSSSKPRNRSNSFSEGMKSKQSSNQPKSLTQSTQGNQFTFRKQNSNNPNQSTSNAEPLDQQQTQNIQNNSTSTQQPKNTTNPNAASSNQQQNQIKQNNQTPAQPQQPQTPANPSDSNSAQPQQQQGNPPAPPANSQPKSNP